MKNSKRNKKLSLLVLLAIISLVVLISSFAKYTGLAGEAKGTAKVATWNVSLDGASDSIFKHEFSKNIVAQDDDDNYIIAPGVSGAYVISITNNGDVAASISDFTLTANSNNPAIDLKFKTTEGGTYSSLANAVAELKTNATTNSDGQPAVVQPGETYTVGTLYWEWPYTAATPNTDVNDTAFGTNSYNSLNSEAATRTSYVLDLSVTATQVAPQI